MPKVSVIIPVYNSEKYIKRTVESILTQTYENFELILVDDASTDRSVEVIQSLQDKRIKLYLNDKNMGISFTRNRGLKQCSGKYIALLDHDDIALEYRLEHEVIYLDTHPDIDVVGGNQKAIDADGNDINRPWHVKLNPDYIKAYLMLSNTMANGTTMFRRAFIEKYNISYKDNMYGAEDYLFWVECSLHGKIANMDEVFLLWRVGHGSESEHVRDCKWDKRKEVLDHIHAYALEQNGYKLTSEQLYILNKSFMEEAIIENEQEMKKLYLALRAIADQARGNKMLNAKEVVTMCRRGFADKIAKAFYLWEDVSVLKESVRD